MSDATDLQETLSLVAESAAAFATPDAPRARKVRDQSGGHDPAFWTGMAEQGWLGALLPESEGGTGLGLRAAAIIAEKLGHACHGEAFVASAIVAVTALLACPVGTRRKSLLDDIASGKRLVSLAWQPDSGALALEAGQVLVSGAGATLTLNGQARFVAAPGAQSFLVAARTALGDSAYVLCEVPATTSGLEIRKEKRSDGSFTARLAFDSVSLPSDAVLASGDIARAAIDGAIDAGVLCTSAELLGLIDRSLTLTLSYLGMRQQFGQLIGSFQVLQHRAVDLWMQKE